MHVKIGFHALNRAAWQKLDLVATNICLPSVAHFHSIGLLLFHDRIDSKRALDTGWHYSFWNVFRDRFCASRPGPNLTLRLCCSDDESTQKISGNHWHHACVFIVVFVLFFAVVVVVVDVYSAFDDDDDSDGGGGDDDDDDDDDDEGNDDGGVLLYTAALCHLLSKFSKL